MVELRARSLSGAQALVGALEAEGVRHLFGVPGHGAYPIYDALNDFPAVAPVVGRNEQGALFAADGYARVSEDIAVATSVPLAGVSNSLTGLWEANGHGSRLLYLVEHDPVHEELLGPAVRYYQKVFSARDVAPAAHALINILRSSRPGVAVLEVPNGVLNTVDTLDPGDGMLSPRPSRSSRSVGEAAALLGGAEKPVICANGYAWDTRSSRALTVLAEALNAPVLTGAMSKGAISDTHPLSLGFNYTAGGPGERLLAEADVVLAIGTRAGMATGARSPEKLGSQLIHLDWDGVEQGPDLAARLALAGHVPTILAEISGRVQPTHRQPWPPERLAEIRETSRRHAAERVPEAISFYGALREAIPTDGLLFTDSLAGLWAARILPAFEPNQVHFPWATGTLGHGIPAAVGAAMFAPNRPIVALCGDGAFLYNSQELAAMRYYRRKLIVVVANDNAFGAVRYNLNLRFGRALAYELANPDFVALGEAYGMTARRLRSPDDIGDAARAAVASGESTLIEVPLSLDPPRL